MDMEGLQSIHRSLEGNVKSFFLTLTKNFNNFHRKQGLINIDFLLIKQTIFHISNTSIINKGGSYIDNIIIDFNGENETKINIFLVKILINC